MKFTCLPQSTLCLLLIMLLFSCDQPVPEEPLLIVREDPVEGLAKAKEIRESTTAILADGLKLDLWASDSLAPDPVAMSIDNHGRVYLTRTNRQKNSEFDIRGHKDWMTASIGLQTPEDRRAFLRKTFATELSDQNNWLEDLNGDSIHDWRDLAVEQDEIWRLEDQSGNGLADISTRIFRDFHEEITDVAGALLVRENDIFLGIGPDMWRLQDRDGDGIPDQKTSISHGYAVHIGFSGHGMSGAIEGPDGKIYWAIGDIGAHIEAPDGKVHKYPNQGIIVRSNPDGSNFEVFAAGLRNTHEFVFDEFGNLISSDNDGDHPGESERLVHIVEGSDAGWRANWQYGKYTDPKNNKYKVWMDEALFKPRWEGQAAYIIPPIVNYHNGPTGMAYNPGTALGTEWKNKFFLVEFVGSPSRSHIWSFGLKPKGASFELGEEVDVLSGILPTGIRFGPDGALYIADWINGWGTKNYGRVWKLDVSEDKDDLKEERMETKRLMQLDYDNQSPETLSGLLAYPDRRIRQKSQFALAKKGNEGLAKLKEATAQEDNQLARIHGIWGIGQAATKNKVHAGTLVALLNDNDAEIVAQAAKIIGDLNYEEAEASLLPLLAHQNPRVRFYAAQALGRIASKDAVTPILNMLEENNGEDLYIRHAGVLALSRIGVIEPVVALANHAQKELRIVAVLVLRRLGNKKVSLFLKDKDEYIVTEAARAINDDWSIEAALPELAAVLEDRRFSSEPLLRRAINACLRVGGEKELDLLISFAARNDIASEMKAETLATLGTWANPSVLDRVDGRYRGKIERSPEPVKSKIQDYVAAFLQDEAAEVSIATVQMLSHLEIKAFNAKMAGIMQKHPDPTVRSAILLALHQLTYDNIESIIKLGMEDAEETVRTTALGLLNELDIAKEALSAIVQPVFDKGTLREQQETLRVLGKMPIDKSEGILDGLLDQMIDQNLSQGLALELIEAVDASGSEKLVAKLSEFQAGHPEEDYSETLFGGNWRSGRNYFFRNTTGQCARCHAVEGYGGAVGPPLGNIGNILSREQLLQALVEPSARLSPGYGNVSFTLKDGQTVTGMLSEETEKELILKTSDAEPLEIPLSRIETRRNLPSGMPAMGTLMSKREIRDMVEFLANLKE